MEFKVSEIAWEEASHELAAIRRQVFVVEQKVPEDLEWDGIDRQCRHVLARDATGRPVGTGRLLPDGHIGRMAVLAPWRGKGIGDAMLLSLLAMARADGHAVALLNAQTYAVPFYTRHGFEPDGEEFMEADIAHRAMRLPLGD
ncbi:MAG: GNAT family N-acetyltransferase [Pseudonocardiaceae bacterium]